MKKIFGVTALFALSILILSACGHNDKQHGKLKVYATNFPYESFVEQIGGKYVDANSIYPSGTDLHNYEPSQREMINIAKSDLFIYSNDELDPVAKKISSTIRSKDHKLEAIPHLNDNELVEHHHEDGESHQHEEDAHEHDPHIWLDPIANKEAAKSIKNKLIEIDPKHKSTYIKNYHHLITDIDKIDKDMQAITKNKKRDTVYISHDSLGYLAKRYHFKQTGVTGMNNEEPSQKELLSIIDGITKQHTPYILYEQNVSSKITDIIKKDTNSKPLKFHNLEVLTKKEAKEKNITYQSIMNQNIETLDKALNK
ncbi:metal ABC transporter solute-binding protein, Zn/Mn family [Mammaliicoccus stepanovicii]|uniref:Mn+2/Zn+2 ABC transporter periplasmic protein n=1 Tax=Mammaliicoccus stepanovicii TaxID=643214 RepID=A0A239ZEN5_9STAP|nr:zinc ABC transporter substrate-binding protein [Mammaliicoccus stepanovicii]PNZ74969.1 ABC transporter substrate-binding protein [Mammaliicoccus stepanovicii]GGI41988.1 ABC transporter substrate-binding protein [Mammaliicoccus stepanovicii]SNV69056.1 Mn+2/Zn+2 ABC transporter periplasmic protein [Mammaliicoccus stepanovicii]